MKNATTTAALKVAAAFALVALAALVLPASAQGQMYRCQGADGSLSFQQLPCAEGTPGQKIEARQVPTTVMGDNILQRAQRNTETRGQLTEADMVQRLGQPSVTNTDVFNGVVSQQHVYRYPDGSVRYVYTRDGVVQGAQVRPAGGRRH